MSEAIGKRYGTWQTFTITWPINKKGEFFLSFGDGTVGRAGGWPCVRACHLPAHA